MYCVCSFKVQYHNLQDKDASCIVYDTNIEPIHICQHCSRFIVKCHVFVSINMDLIHQCCVIVLLHTPNHVEDSITILAIF